MSTKKTSPTASLATCLDFAARILSSTASVQEVCTKAVLAPMVVESHRYGQRACKNLEYGDVTDVRKLLGILQGEQYKKLSQELPLGKLNVADLTWDFEGTVADTLEMEFADLEGRAGTSLLETCVVFSASSPMSNTGQAVIWFPREDNKRNESVEIYGKGKRQCLLYVYPGRVKVVKSVGELIKKMYNELPTLRDAEATYNVWAVVMSEPKDDNQLENHRCSVELKMVKESVQTSRRSSKSLNGPADVISVFASSMPGEEHFSIARSSETVKEDGEANVELRDPSLNIRNSDDPAGVPLVQQNCESCQASLPPLSPQFSVHRGAIDLISSSARSMFLFGVDPNAQSYLQRRSSGCALDNRNDHTEDENDSTNVAHQESTVDSLEKPLLMGNEDKEEGAYYVDNQRTEFRPVRSKVSSSLADISTSTRSNGFDTENGLGLGIRLHQGLAWQSCDGKILRNSVRSHQPTTCTESELVPNSLKDKVTNKSMDAKADNSCAHDKTHAEENCALISCINEVHQFPSLYRQSLGRLPYIVGDIDNKKDSAAVADSPIFSNEIEDANPDFEDSLSSSPNCSTNRSIAIQDAVTISENADENELLGDSSNELRLLQQTAPKKKREEDSVEPSESTIESVLQVPKPVVNYKDKLGARIWWEIEYTARKLEREEMLELRQLATISPKITRRTVPKGWSKRNHIAKHKGDAVLAGDTTTNCPDLPVITKSVSKSSDQLVESNGVSFPPVSVHESVLEARPIHSHPDSDNSKVQPPGVEPEFIPTKANSTWSSNGIDEATKCDEVRPISTVRDKKHLCGNENREAKQNYQTSGYLNAQIRASIVATDDFTELANISFDSSRKKRESSITESCVTSSTQRRSPRFKKYDNQNENEDETMARIMWGSTHTSYDLNNTDEPKEPRKEELSVPFTLRGRVPIRTHRTLSKANALDTQKSESERTDSATCQITQVKPMPPPVSSFIDLGEDNNAVTASSGSREDRLNELRKKKLRKLQQTREESQQQKQSQRQVYRPLSFASTVYSKKASNRQLMQNALEFTLLAGGSMEKERRLALQALAQSSCDNFIVLLKSAKELKFRALYENHTEQDSATRIYSVLSSNSARAPLKIGSSELISQFFKYSSAKKQFLPVPTRSFTVKTDACALVDQLVFKGKPKSSSSTLSRLL
ncbi:unnamed protein product [Phytophthora lilii]|uniref:Unnamed protein product n=1 Tax=Phytophthora lilii TaxID=2077276 RepID=A0A9W6TGA2_9STRA|nr:unnamed protein product [Phytophthora lilii]